MECHTGTHHLNNYYHNGKSTGMLRGFVWDPFKRCFWASSSLSSQQQTSQVSYGTQLYMCFRAASTLSSLQQTLFAIIVWSSIRDPLGQGFGVASTLSLLNQTFRYHEAADGTHLKICVRAAAVLSLLLWALGHRLGPHFG